MFNLSANVSSTSSLSCDFISAIICHFHTSNVLIYCISLLLAVLEQFGAIHGRASSNMRFLCCSCGACIRTIVSFCSVVPAISISTSMIAFGTLEFVCVSTCCLYYGLLSYVQLLSLH